MREQSALIDSGKAGTRESGVTMQESAKSIRSLNKQQQTGMAAAESKGISYDSLLARQLARLSEMEEYKNLSETELQDIAYDETIAEMSETILTDTDAANRLSQQIYKQDRTLWQKIKDFFTGLVEKLRNAYRDSDPDSDIGRMLKRAVQDNAEIAQAWAEAVREAGENYRLQDGQKKNARVGERFSLREYDAAAKAFSNEISEWDESGRDGSSRFILGSTGEVLQGLGAIESDIYMNGSKINTILQDHPEITLREIKRIPEILNDPVLVLKSRNVGRGNSQNTRMTIFGTVKGLNGLPVMTVFDLRPSENHFVIDDMQKVTSAYTKTNSATSFVSNSFVLYADKKRTTSLLRTIGFQMPIELLQSGYVGNITYNKQNVNIYGEKFSDVVGAENAVRYSSRNQTESKEFKRWLGDWQNAPAKASKVVNADGTPKVMYHGTNAEFTVFDRAQGKKKVHLNVFGDGNYFTALREGASRYGANVVEAYLDIKNPYVKKDGFNTVADQIASEFGIARDSIKGSDVSSFLRQRGYDGRL